MTKTTNNTKYTKQKEEQYQYKEHSERTKWTTEGNARQWLILNNYICYLAVSLETSSPERAIMLVVVVGVVGVVVIVVVIVVA